MIFVVDDDTFAGESLTLLLENENYQVERFASAEDFLAANRPQANSCAIMEVCLPGINGLELQTELARRGVGLPIIFLTDHGTIQMGVQAIKNGAVDFLTKPASATALLASVKAALLKGEQWQAQEEARQKACACLAILTEREREIMLLAIEGLCNKVIARMLNISHRTVEIHKIRIMQKTGAQNVLELARIAQLSEMHPTDTKNASVSMSFQRTSAGRNLHC